MMDMEQWHKFWLWLLVCLIIATIWAIVGIKLAAIIIPYSPKFVVILFTISWLMLLLYCLYKLRVWWWDKDFGRKK